MILKENEDIHIGFIIKFVNNLNRYQGETDVDITTHKLDYFSKINLFINLDINMEYNSFVLEIKDINK